MCDPEEFDAFCQDFKVTKAVSWLQTYIREMQESFEQNGIA